MTTEQAIKLLNRLQDEQFDGPHGDERREALEMAVRALSGDGDTISRKMAIDAFVKYVADGYAESPNDFEGYMEIVKKLLSAQPEVLVCGSGELVQESDDLVKDLVKDCISRQAAIDALNDEYHGMISDESMKIYQIINWISALPPAQPELIERGAYVRGFEQGRTQGMIDAKEGKK